MSAVETSHDVPRHLALPQMVHRLKPIHVGAAALDIEQRRTAVAERAVLSWFGLGDPAAVATPFAYQVAVVARERGVLAFDRLERVFLPPPQGWRRHDQDPSLFRIVRHSDHLETSRVWPFRHDGPVADFEASGRAAAWSGALVQGLLAFAWWPEMTEWELAHMVRLGDAAGAVHLRHLGELGRGACELHPPGGPLDDPDCPACAEQEEAARADPRERERRIRDPSSRAVAHDALLLLREETEACVQGLEQHDLVLPSRRLPDIGDACDYAAAHHRRMMSPSFRRWLDHCCREGLDYAPSGAAWLDRVRDVVVALLTPVDPAPDRAAVRARSVLRDLGSRLCHAATLRRDERLYGRGLAAIADAVDRLEAGPREDEAEDVLADALEEVVASVSDAPGMPGLMELLAVGYRPTLQEESEPVELRMARQAAYVRRLDAARSPMRVPIAGARRLVERVLDLPRRARPADEVAEAARQLVAEGSLPDAVGELVSWLHTTSRQWGPLNPQERLSERWYYRLATRTLPPPEQWPGWRLRLNPYLTVLPCPFDPSWLDEAFRKADGPAFDVQPREAASLAWVLVGPGRATRVFLPMTSDRARLLDEVAGRPTVEHVLRGKGLPEKVVRDALEEELLLCLAE